MEQRDLAARSCAPSFSASEMAANPDDGFIPNTSAKALPSVRRPLKRSWRLHYDLTGLPPTIDELDSMANQQSQSAISNHRPSGRSPLWRETGRIG
jgi:hypothetical protein